MTNSHSRLVDLLDQIEVGMLDYASSVKKKKSDAKGNNSIPDSIKRMQIEATTLAKSLFLHKETKSVRESDLIVFCSDYDLSIQRMSCSDDSASFTLVHGHYQHQVDIVW